MGTNFYAHMDTCEHCNRAEVIHIGKRSGGWEFLFHGTDSIQSWADWKVELKRAHTKIFDEYGKEHSFAEFCKVVEGSISPDHKNHFNYCLESHPESMRDLWIDEEGLTFSSNQFS